MCMPGQIKFAFDFEFDNVGHSDKFIFLPEMDKDPELQAPLCGYFLKGVECPIPFCAFVHHAIKPETPSRRKEILKIGQYEHCDVLLTEFDDQEQEMWAAGTIIEVSDDHLKIHIRFDASGFEPADFYGPDPKSHKCVITLVRGAEDFRIAAPQSKCDREDMKQQRSSEGEEKHADDSLQPSGVQLSPFVFYNEDETNELDLVFCLDCTGSMGSYIKSAQENIVNITNAITSSGGASVRVSFIPYRDHPPQDSSFITKVHDFTSETELMLGYVNAMSASGGGDGPEAVTAALHDALHLEYRPKATKIVVIIADAPPHGLGENGDGFPEGDPQGKDPLQIVHQMLGEGIILYSVACEPAVSGFQYARDFFEAIANIAEGQFIPLSSASLLSEVIVGGSLEEMSLEGLSEVVMSEYEKVRGQLGDVVEGKSEDAVIEEVARRMQKQGFTTTKIKLDGSNKPKSAENVKIFKTCETLKDARTKLQPTTGGITYGSSRGQSARQEVELIDADQIRRLIKRYRAQKARREEKQRSAEKSDQSVDKEGAAE